ncbi:hypothetical protein GRAN_3645 [Granulicella sibirica]|uniref:Uncharacterized protein n=1 Tax=Granulicella sibirica TaxID=2479048 RepID=A0A4Q0SVW0_9BACT|nr:hypothetical protein GRAN_3645 [Granulicella sibirica]
MNCHCVSLRGLVCAFTRMVGGTHGAPEEDVLSARVCFTR